jgi:transcriptional regulator with XRE-family HTH domain
MGRNNRAARRTAAQAGADRSSDELAARVGLMLRDARRQRGLTQAAAANLAGVSASTWSWLEIGRDGRITLATLNRAAMAVGTSLNVYVRQASAAAQPRDAVHLRHQELVIKTAKAGLWLPLPEEPIDRDARTSRAADVLLCRRTPGAAACYVLVEIWDWLDDVGAATRDWGRRLDATERYAIARMLDDDPLPRTSGIWVLRATQRNRQLVNEHRGFFRARFPGPGHAWLAALTDATRQMPSHPALLWVTVTGDRLYPARLG